ncbi:MAG: peptide chain release factor 1 [Microcoleaceae cyanobacterium]
MNNLIQRLKQLPWRWLLQNAAIATLLVMAIELLLKSALDLDPSSTVERVLQILYAPPFGLIVPILTAMGMGAFSVYLFEPQKQQYLLNSSTLWALVFCLLLCLWIKSLLPVLPFLTSLSRYAFIGILIGVFWKGRPYWRY